MKEKRFSHEEVRTLIAETSGNYQHSVAALHLDQSLSSICFQWPAKAHRDHRCVWMNLQGKVEREHSLLFGSEHLSYESPPVALRRELHEEYSCREIIGKPVYLVSTKLEPSPWNRGAHKYRWLHWYLLVTPIIEGWKVKARAVHEIVWVNEQRAIAQKITTMREEKRAAFMAAVAAFCDLPERKWESGQRLLRPVLQAYKEAKKPEVARSTSQTVGLVPAVFYLRI